MFFNFLVSDTESVSHVRDLILPSRYKNEYKGKYSHQTQIRKYIGILCHPCFISGIHKKNPQKNPKPTNQPKSNQTKNHKKC